MIAGQGENDVRKCLGDVFCFSYFALELYHDRIDWDRMETTMIIVVEILKFVYVGVYFVP